MRFALRLEPADRHHPDRNRGAEKRVAKIQAMGRRKSRDLVYLLSDAAKDVTGQIFAVRMNEIFLMSQSRPVRSCIAKTAGPATRCKPAMPALAPPLSARPLGDVFSWDPI